MKSNIKIPLFVLLLATSAIMQSCNEDNDPALGKVSLEMKAQTVQSSISTGKTMNTGLVFNTILIGVTELEFETIEENEIEDIAGESEEEEVEYEGNYVVDLINGTSTPDFGLADIAPGVYEEMEMELAPILDGGHSIFVAFDFTNTNNEVISVEYSNDEALEFELENEAGFVLDGGATNQMLVLLDLDALFANINLNTAYADNDGVVRINSSSNTDLAAAIATNLEMVFEAGEDHDDDGEID